MRTRAASVMDAMLTPRYPSLYQINTRVRLTELTRQLGRPATLDDIPDADLQSLKRRGFDWVWLLSVWQTGAAARKISQSNPEWRREFEETLPDLTDDDIGGSGFAINSYTVSRSLGGDAALARLRARLRQHDLKLMLDFVPNHMAPDHPWVEHYPEYFVGGSDSDLARAPQDYVRVAVPGGSRVIAHGRDPYLASWPDTIQLNYGHPVLQGAMIGELKRIAGQCDGVRCDMAMLVLPEVFERTWGIKSLPFWPSAIRRVRTLHPKFMFMAEVYWDLEWTLQQQGFDYCYDKRLYDRLLESDARRVREHLQAGLDFQDHLVRFLENHDEPRVATAFDWPRHQAAAVVTYLSPGLRLFHQGQLEGRHQRISPHLVRGPDERTDPEVTDFYERLLAVLKLPAVRDGHWSLVDCQRAWEGNGSHENLIASAWEKSASERVIVIVNDSDHPSQARVQLPFACEPGATTRFQELIGEGTYDRQGSDLTANGLFVDLPAWNSHLFSVSTIE